MNPLKLFLALSAILCVSMLYAEESNTYIKQQVAYKDQGLFHRFAVSRFHHSQLLP